MKRYYQVKLYTGIEEVITVRATDEDDAAELALEIVKCGYTPNNRLDWDIEEITLGDKLDVAE